MLWKSKLPWAMWIVATAFVLSISAVRAADLAPATTNILDGHA
jgi:hypothetical protein